MIRRNPRFWFLNCCISPQSEIARIRIDRSMIGGPTDFRHIGHMGASDLNATFNVDAISCLLRSKGDECYSLPVPQHLRANDVPIRGNFRTIGYLNASRNLCKKSNVIIL